MVDVSLNALVSKLNPTCHGALEQAAWLCRSMTHYDIELEHLLLKLAEEDDIDVAKILQHFDANISRLVQDLTAAAERLKRGNTRDTPNISPRIPELFQAAWLHASVELGETQIRSGSLLYALCADADFALMARDMSSQFHLIDTDELDKKYFDIVKGSREQTAAPGVAPGAAPRRGASPGRPGEQAALEQYTIDLTGKAKAGEIDPVLGRDAEIRLMIDILMRRRQNNPILTGEAGVGKTAVVEGFAKRIAEGDVPEPLRNVTVRTLDLGLLQAGAGVRGEFESRLKGVIDEVKESPTPIILFIDEAHTMIGAGGAEGQSDAANLLKPALARGELRTVAATTWAEYKKYFEKDAALARRFQVVPINEPDVETATIMLRGLAETMEKHHRVKLLPEAVESAVRLSDRYLSDRQLPDKAVGVLDTAAARVAMGQGAKPPAVEDAERHIQNLEVEERILKREVASGTLEADGRLSEIAGELDEWRARLEEITGRWNREKELVQRILTVRDKLDPAFKTEEGEPITETERTAARTELREAEAELDEIQGEEPLMRPYVDGQIAAEVIGGWTGIPVGRMMADEVKTILELESLLGERVVGQDHALEAIAQRIRTSRASLSDPKQPIGVFLLVGPSGVGKTETGLALSELLYGGERNIISINMSEFQEAHTVSQLKGSPPGYVGYGEGGVLTEAVRRRPYSVVLLDETEKAHPDVMELFYQVFDKGALEDGQGRMIDFKNTIILCTSNLGTDTIVKLCADEETAPDFPTLANAIHSDVVAHFKPALVGRMTVVPYYPLHPEIMRRIINLKVNKIRNRLREYHGVELTLTEGAVDTVLSRCTEPDTGARNIDHILTGTVMPALSHRILSGLVEGESFSRIQVDVGADGSFAYSTKPEG